MTEQPATLTEEDAAHAWALAYNTLDPSPLMAVVHHDIRVASQAVLEEMEGTDRYLGYLIEKFAAFERSDADVRIELGETAPYPMAPNRPRPCAIGHQYGRPFVTVLFEVEDGTIRRIDVCFIPPPQTCRGSGVFPGLDDPPHPESHQ